MKCAIVVCLMAVVAAAVAADDHYTTKYDDIDIDGIINNKRLLDNYVACLLKKGSCTEEGAVLKDIIPDALITDCVKCNDHQKAYVDKVIKHLIKNRSSDWESLKNLYDPQGIYADKYAHYLEKL